MKNKTLLITTITGFFVVILILLLNPRNNTVNCDETTSLPEPPTYEDCDYDARIPQSVDELNEMIQYRYDLSDNCNFQPFHTQIRKDKSSTIIARFTAHKTKTNVYNLTKVELKHFEITNGTPINIVVSSAKIEKKNGTIEVHITLKEGKGASNEVYTLNTNIKVKRGDIIDAKVDESGLYRNQQFKSSTKSMMYVRGKQCNGTIVF